MLLEGACTASFPLINIEYPHVLSFICPAHSLDNFMKNVCSAKASITVKGNNGHFAWGEDFMEKVVQETNHVVKFVTNHQKAKGPCAVPRAVC